jgi:diguanylate cyclase (GGDEF)-like protein
MARHASRRPPDGYAQAPSDSDDVRPGAATARAARAAQDVPVETMMRRARWIGAALASVQFALYVPPPGVVMPFSRWWGALPVCLLVAINLEAVRRALRGTSKSPRWALVQLIWDTGVIALIIGMFTWDVTSALWTMLIIPVLEAATRGWSRRALLTFGVLCVGYVGRELLAAVIFDQPVLTVDSITYRLGVLGIVASVTAGLAARLTRQIANTAAAEAEAGQLRDLAVATRRMSSLDVPTVVREVTRAAERFGFTGVHLRSRAGVVLGSDPAPDQTWYPTPQWFETAAAATEETGYAVLDAADSGLHLQGDEGLVAASVTAGDTVEALLVGRHVLPLGRRQTEGLTLLAAQASAALANALRYEEGRAFEERLAHQATHDVLTGLPNRTLLRDRARATLARSRRNASLVAVMFIDLDRFKEVNDVLGHATGDALLQQVAARVLAQLRPEDTCARVGGDEFVVVTGNHSDSASVLELAQRVRAAVLAPFEVDGLALDIEGSLGVAWAPNHGDDVDTLLRRADVAMYAAKNRREGVVVYSDADDRLTPVHLTTLGDLRRALDSEGQLVTHFQPIIQLAGGELASVEALVRWHHPRRGLVPPDDFIPLAEGTSVIHQITDHVLNLSLVSLREWLERGLDIRLAVNLSARTLLDVSFSQRLASLLDRNTVVADRLRLEITESTLLADPTRAIATMHRLRELGLRLSIDDFGTGYSSMNYLKSLPVDEIKIDRTFVTDMLRSARDGAVVHSVVDLAHSLGLHVVAEGVEDEATLHALASVGCDLAQGFHVGRPMTSVALFAWAEQRHDLRPRSGATAAGTI